MNVNEHGLVLCKVSRKFDIYKAGTLAGFEPHIARALAENGKVVTGRNVDGKFVADASTDRSEPKEEVKTLLVATEKGTVQIPENWREAHHNKRIAWAKSISGKDELSTDDANEIIASAVKDQEDGE